MSKVRLKMAIQEEILRLKGLGHSKKKVAELIGINRETVRKYWLGPPEHIIEKVPLWAKKLDWKYLKEEIKHKTPKNILFEELSESTSLPSYQAFCKYIRKNYSEDLEDKVVVKIQRINGESIEVDYSGDGVDIINPATGKIHTAQLFVGTLSSSKYFYAEFTMTQKIEDFVLSHNNMFSFFGGATKYIIPDNCKTAVIKTDKYDPEINKTYNDMCKHYSITVDPADGYSPTHKPNVEKGVHIIQQDFFPRIRNKTFTSLFELNKELKKWLTEKNKKVMKGRGNSREHYFQKEKLTLRPLPEFHYEIFKFKKVKVHPDCHFQFQKNFYSVPYRFIGKELDLKFNNKTVHAYFNIERISSHSVLKGHGHYSTVNEHYPEKKIVEINYHLSKAKIEAKKVGPHMDILVTKLIAQEKFPLKILRKVQGVLSLSQKFEKAALESSAKLCLEFNKLNYMSVKNFAKNYNPKKESNNNAPIRAGNLICLQGGTNE